MEAVPCRGRADITHHPQLRLVSLFGLNSLEALRYAIYENKVPASNAGAAATWDTLASACANAKTGVRKVRSPLGVASGMETIAGVNFGVVGDLIARSSFLFVRDQIICLDDLERAGEGLAAKDVLGLISSLKEERNCSVAPLLNDGALKPSEREDMQRFLEKVIDVALAFVPTPAEAARVALQDGADGVAQLRDHVEALDITNIRVIRENGVLTGKVFEILAGKPKAIVDWVITSLALAGWAVFEPDRAPSPEYLESFDPLLDELVREPDDCGAGAAQNITWRRQLARLGLSYPDELDPDIFDGAARGYFDEDAILTLAGDLEVELKDLSRAESYSRA